MLEFDMVSQTHFYILLLGEKRNARITVNSPNDSFWLVFEKGFCYVAQAGLKLEFLLSQPTKF
jgi:hypothetical protein